MLDGWRAASILAVMIGHWLPLGFRAWQFNAMTATAGMAIFFALSGFLITRLLLIDSRPVPFLIRRFARIVPLAWLAMTILLIASRPGWEAAARNFLFLSNLPPAVLLPGGEHLWSLCVEVQFYIGMALLMWLGGRKSLLLLPLLAFVVTLARVKAGEPISIVTWHRVDEILSGASVALICRRFPPNLYRRRIPAALTLVFLGLLLVSSHPASGPLQYARPYFGAAALGFSLYASPVMMQRLWRSDFAAYIARISYALYVVHGMLSHSWLGGYGAGRLQGYLRRPLLIAVTFAVAHFSTLYYESRWINWGKRLVARFFPLPGRPSH